MAVREDDMLQLPGHYFSRIAKGMGRIADARLRPFDLASAQLPVLMLLKDGSARSQSELARLVKVEQPSMAQLLARMQRDGLVARAPDPSDGRASLVSLTDKAKARLPGARAELLRANADMTAGLSAEEVETLLGLLRRVLANIESLDP